MDTLIIGITGTMGSGKTTLARALQATPELHDVELRGFADELKRDVKEMIAIQSGFDIDEITERRLKGSSLGLIYQGYGQFCREIFGTDFWIKCLEADIPERVIIHDVRYQNEVEWIKSLGGILISVVGPSRNKNEQRNPGHESETQVQDLRALADVTVMNTGTYDDLVKQAQNIATNIVGVTPGDIPV